MKWTSEGGFVRISKRVAEKMYAAGEVIYMCPCQLRPGAPWSPEVAVCLTDGEGARVAPVAFEGAVSMFSFYNCNYGAGYYPAYYIKGGTV